ncbi:hypothetical protein [Mesorhizobium sp. C089B]|nr:hypothetical protein [Mesorhizobium sp. C089B]WJI54493.1 hypothetical protein NLY44_27980 [Mesorhizobium sp. C089B]
MSRLPCRRRSTTAWSAPADRSLLDEPAQERIRALAADFPRTIPSLKTNP